MGEVSPHAKAHEAIGAYFCAFSALERELGETIKVIFRLQEHEASDTIVAALGDVTKKINLVWSATQLAKNADGSETSEAWKGNAENTMKGTLECNGDRVRLAHSYLEADADGSVELTRLQVSGGELKGKTKERWKREDFDSKIKQLNERTEQVKALRGSLLQFNIPTPRIGWMSIDPYQPAMLRAARQYMMNSPEGPLTLRAITAASEKPEPSK